MRLVICVLILFSLFGCSQEPPGRCYLLCAVYLATDDIDHAYETFYRDREQYPESGQVAQYAEHFGADHLVIIENPQPDDFSLCNEYQAPCSIQYKGHHYTHAAIYLDGLIYDANECDYGCDMKHISDYRITHLFIAFSRM